jgi:hypothetical protein
MPADDPVGSAISHVEGEYRVFAHHNTGNRCTHADTCRILRHGPVDSRVGTLNGLGDFDFTRHRTRLLDQTLRGQPARDLAGRVATHAIRDETQYPRQDRALHTRGLVGGRHDKPPPQGNRVLVVLPHTTRMGETDRPQPSHADTHLQRRVLLKCLRQITLSENLLLCSGEWGVGRQLKPSLAVLAGETVGLSRKRTSLRRDRDDAIRRPGVRGAVFRARIGANESVFGPSPKAIAAMQLAAVNGGYIAIPRTTISKRRFAQKLGLSTANIVVGEGIDSLFGYTVRLFAQRGVAARGAARRRSRQQMSR